MTVAFILCAFAPAFAEDVPIPEPKPDAAKLEAAQTSETAAPTDEGSDDAVKPESGEASPSGPDGDRPRAAGEQAEPATADASRPSEGDPLNSEPAEGDVPLPSARPDPSAAPIDPPAPSEPTGSKARDTRALGAVPNRSEKPDITPSAAVRAARAVAASLACEDILRERGIEFDVRPSISEDRCGVLRPVAVTKLSSGITVEPATALWCPTVLALDDWTRQTLLPAAKTFEPDHALTGLRQVSTYVCRDRGSGQKISEHARGSAIDIGAFIFDDGERSVSPRQKGSEGEAFQKAAHEGACGPFSTVLGPGADADHANHFHLDLAARSNGPFCQ
ncbi:extensin family protein [Fulvimarina manganoxydans]|uniref:extensin family protein n=1 Tax=Fulvimarina manganoxydans TaxID=937218 RepID=UPI0014820EF5|nr:extensin family protein [Fulvimarina manganoxydans]